MGSDKTLPAQPVQPDFPAPAEPEPEPEPPFVGFATTVGIRELASRVSRVVNEVVISGRPAVITKHGLPIAMIIAIEPADAALEAADAIAAASLG